MTLNIPASAIVQVNPGVIDAGGTSLALNGLMLTSSPVVPIGAIYSYASAAAVATAFGGSSAEAAAALVYFLGFDNSSIKPAALNFAQYPVAAVKPFILGGAGLTLAQVQAITSGTFSAIINGVNKTSGALNLASAVSFSDAAASITTALAAYDASSTTTSISGTALTVAGTVTGAIAIGQVVSGAGITGSPTIVSGSGLSWTISSSQSVSGITVSYGQAVVSYNSLAGAFELTGGTPGVGTIAYATGTNAAPLKLTAATGAVLSQGAPVAVPGTFMNGVVDGFQDFASFSTIFEPSSADKVLFAAWNNGQNNRYAYVMPDSSAAPTVVPDTTSAGHQIIAAGYSGTVPIYDPNWTWKGAFNMGCMASINFEATGGRITYAFKSQGGLVADVNSLTVANNLIANGYNFYGAYATAAQGFVFYYPGSVTGDFIWEDSYTDQIQLNQALQLSLMELLTTVNSIPYNTAGFTLINAACLGPIQVAVNAGSIAPGVTLSPLQKAEINGGAGLDITPMLFQQGWYLQIKAPSSTVRQARGSPVITLWYTDGQSVQKITLASLDVL